MGSRFGNSVTEFSNRFRECKNAGTRQEREDFVVNKRDSRRLGSRSRQALSLPRVQRYLRTLPHVRRLAAAQVKSCRSSSNPHVLMTISRSAD